MLLFIIMYLFPQEVSQVQQLVQHLVKTYNSKSWRRRQKLLLLLPAVKNMLLNNSTALSTDTANHHHHY